MPSMFIALLFKIIPLATIGWLGYSFYKDYRASQARMWPPRETPPEQPEAPTTRERETTLK